VSSHVTVGPLASNIASRSSAKSYSIAKAIEAAIQMSQKDKHPQAHIMVRKPPFLLRERQEQLEHCLETDVMPQNSPSAPSPSFSPASRLEAVSLAMYHPPTTSDLSQPPSNRKSRSAPAPSPPWRPVSPSVSSTPLAATACKTARPTASSSPCLRA
jgi:hypothetical protein